MAGLEVVVRPVVLPNIRPAPAQTLPPAADPEKGFCTISGNPATQVDLTTSWSTSTSKSHSVEAERRVDKVRVYQEDDDGTVNQDNFVDMNVANRIKMNEHGRRQEGDPIPDLVKHNFYYGPVHETDSVEILEKDLIIKNPDVTE